MEQHTIITSLVFIFGCILGSFFNVLIWRIPSQKSILFPASCCPTCETPIKFYHNIPLFGFLICGGKCAHCKEPISMMYPVVELATGVLATLFYLHSEQSFLMTTPWGSIVPGVQGLWLLLLIPMVVIDLKHYIIPDSFTLPAIAIGIILSFVPSGVTPIESILGILSGGGSLYIIGFIGSLLLKREDVMGGGDIKLMAAAGALFGWKLAFISIILGAFLGSFAGIALIAFRKLKLDNKIPFGPFLGLGIWTAAFWGDAILAWYLSLMNYQTY